MHAHTERERARGEGGRIRAGVCREPTWRNGEDR